MAASFRASLGTASWLSVVFDQRRSIWRWVTNKKSWLRPHEKILAAVRFDLHDKFNGIGTRHSQGWGLYYATPA